MAPVGAVAILGALENDIILSVQQPVVEVRVYLSE
jgi:hypothetical protein